MLTLVLIGLLSGSVTAVSPCVLPVLPVIFLGAGSLAPSRRQRSNALQRAGADARGERKINNALARRRSVIIVAGLVLSFAVVTLAGSLLLTTLHLPSGALRWAGVLVLFVVGLGLVVPAVEHLAQRPFTGLPHVDASRAGGPFLLGLALGTLYVPCAGPVIAVVAIAGTAGQVTGGILVLTAAFSIGTALPLLLFAYAGERVADKMSGLRSGARRFRHAGGAVMMALALMLTFNLTDGLQRILPTYTAAIQDSIDSNDAANQALQAVSPNAPAGAATGTPVPTHNSTAPAAVAAGPVVACRSAAADLANCGKAADLLGIDTWINTPDGAPPTLAELRGKVVLVDFWTYGCINCQHVLPHVTSWYDAYRDSGLVVVGIHTPEFSFERDADNVRDAVATHRIHYPVGLDNSSATWRNYHNNYWPAAYLIDATGTVRYVKFGEGDYARTESLIRQLLVAANADVALPPETEPTTG